MTDRLRDQSRLSVDGAAIIPFSTSAPATRGKIDGALKEVGVLDVMLDGEDETDQLQAQITALPSRGGRLVAPQGNYGWLTPTSLTVTLHKMVSWQDHSGSLPEGMPGCVETSGYRMQPGETTGAINPRPGDAYKRFIVRSHIPDPAQASQQDSVLYIEGNVPAYTNGLASEFAALRFNMTSAATDNVNTPGNLDIKGLQGVVRGVGGNAKVRSIRTGSFGIGGHDGIVTGGMFAAVRWGVIPNSMGGNGSNEFASGSAPPSYKSGDAAVIAQVGPGIQAVFRAEGFSGVERPQYVWLQAVGGQAVLPQQAVFGLHGGGAGLIVELKKSDTDSTVIQQWNNDGRFSAVAFRSHPTGLSIPDDGVLTIPLPRTHGMFKFWIENNLGANAEIQYRGLAAGAVGSEQSSAGSLVDVKAAGTNLTGTTGTDGRVSISVYQDSIKIENRLGATRNVGFLFMAN